MKRLLMIGAAVLGCVIVVNPTTCQTRINRFKPEHQAAARKKYCKPVHGLWESPVWKRGRP